jgi:hypothetical protein
MTPIRANQRLPFAARTFATDARLDTETRSSRPLVNAKTMSFAIHPHIMLVSHGIALLENLLDRSPMTISCSCRGVR